MKDGLAIPGSRRDGLKQRRGGGGAVGDDQNA
jgi:hypothetical protein